TTRPGTTIWAVTKCRFAPQWGAIARRSILLSGLQPRRNSQPLTPSHGCASSERRIGFLLLPPQMERPGSSMQCKLCRLPAWSMSVPRSPRTTRRLARKLAFATIRNPSPHKVRDRSQRSVETLLYSGEVIDQSEAMKRTPLYETHQRLGAKLIEFGGWEMPVQYTSITDEHLTVRKAAGLFDISHMGEIMVGGPAAESFLNATLTNDVRKLAPGQGQYTLCCNERGGVIDDLYVYRLSTSEYLLIVNASRIEADAAWLNQQLSMFPNRSAVTLRNDSEVTGALAVQGPRVAEFIDECFAGPASAGTAAPQPSKLQ